MTEIWHGVSRRIPRLMRRSGGFYKPALVGIPIAETHGQLKHRRLSMDKVLLMIVALVAALKSEGRSDRTEVPQGSRTLFPARQYDHMSDNLATVSSPLSS